MTELAEYNHDTCTACGSNMVGEPIPKGSRQWYGDQTHFSRWVGRSWNDRVQEWICPDCGAIFDRWTGKQKEKTGYIEGKDIPF